MLGSAPTVHPLTDSLDSPEDLIEFYSNLPFLKTCSSLPPHFLLLLKQKSKCLSRTIRQLTSNPTHNNHPHHQTIPNSSIQTLPAEKIVDPTPINKSKQEVNHKAGRPPATPKSTAAHPLPSSPHPAIRKLQLEISTKASINGASC